jgi:hypothetical protein
MQFKVGDNVIFSKSGRIGKTDIVNFKGTIVKANLQYRCDGSNYEEYLVRFTCQHKEEGVRLNNQYLDWVYNNGRSISLYEGKAIINYIKPDNTNKFYTKEWNFWEN